MLDDDRLQNFSSFLEQQSFMMRPIGSFIHERPSALETLAGSHPDEAIHLARVLGRIKTRHEAVLGAVEQSRDVIRETSAALIEEVRSGGIGPRGIEFSAESFVTIPGTSGWCSGPERARAGFRVIIRRL